MIEVVPPKPSEREGQLIDSSNLRNKNTTCARCGNGHGAKRWKYTLTGNRRCYLCAPCIHELGGSALALQWLESRIPFNLPNKEVVQ